LDSASFQFVIFGLVAAIVSNFSQSVVWRSCVLFAASAVFVGILAPHPMVLLPMLGFLLLGYLMLGLVERGWAKASALGIAVVLFAFVWLKKYTFLPEGIFLHSPYFTLGLSYIFFRVVHLLVDARDSQSKQRIGLGAYLLYTLNFTTLVSGPIQRYEEFARDQFASEPPALDIMLVGRQLERIVVGLFKVNVLAMLLDLVRNDALAQLMQPLPPVQKFFAAILLVLAYPVFLYANFSGYIDIVIALARLMRLRLPENFDRPFSAACVMDFWNQWHMTLSTWFKTYVYNPLLIAMMRRISALSWQPFFGVICFFVTFFLVGVWHGRTSEFLVFGLLTGAGISINKLWQIAITNKLGRKGYKALAANAVYMALGRGITYIWFAFTLFWFWGDWKHIAKAFSAVGAAEWIAVWGVALAVATVTLAAWEGIRALLMPAATADGAILSSRYARVVYASALCLAALVMTVMLNQPAPGIVYKVF
jgi:alginate O-acetyltransferase complex protein AlgI